MYNIDPTGIVRIVVDGVLKHAGYVLPVNVDDTKHGYGFLAVKPGQDVNQADHFGGRNSAIELLVRCAFWREMGIRINEQLTVGELE
jgi:hypothetical protein